MSIDFNANNAIRSQRIYEINDVQYLLTNDCYEITNVFQAIETVTSPNITCVSFTIKDIRSVFCY